MSCRRSLTNAGRINDIRASVTLMSKDGFVMGYDEKCDTDD